MTERIWQKGNPETMVAFVEKNNNETRTHVLTDNGVKAFIIEEKKTQDGRVLTQVVDPLTGAISGEHVE